MSHGFRIVVGRLLFAAIMLSMLLPLAPKAQAYASSFILSSGAYGANSEVILEYGVLTRDCDTIYTSSDIFVVPRGSAVPGANLNDLDPSGEPNTFTAGGMGGVIEQGIIGLTAPSGRLGAGAWDVVEDTCQDGIFNGSDTVLSPGFSVVLPDNVGSLPTDAFDALKAEAAEQATQDRYAAAYAAATFIIYDVYSMWGDRLQRRPDGSIDPQSAVNFYLSYVCTGFSLAGVLQIPTDSEGGTAPITPWCPTVGINDIITLQLGTIDTLLDEASHFDGIAADPPDPNFAAPAVLAARDTFAERTADSLEPAVLLYGRRVADSKALSQALLASLEKYQGAELTAKGTEALMHARNIQQYASLLADNLEGTSAAIDQMLAVLAPHTAGLEALAADLATERDRVMAQGFNPEEDALLRDLGLTDEHLESLALYLEYGPFDIYTEHGTAASFYAGVKAQNATNAAALRAFAGAVETNVQDLVNQGLDLLPHAHAGGPYTVAEGAPVTFDATQSTHPAGLSLSYAWDLDGDGAFDDATVAQPTYSYTQAYTGLVGLKVTDSAGRANVAYAPLQVTQANRPPSFTGFSPVRTEAVQVLAGETATFTAQASDPDGDSVALQWLVDGAPAGTGTSFTFAAGATAGVHAVKVIATDASPLGGRVEADWLVLTRVPYTGTAPTAAFVPQGPGRNVALTERGAAVQAFSSQWNSAHNPAGILGYTVPYYPWATAEGQRQGQYMIFSLAGGRSYLVDRIRIRPRPSYAEQRVKDFEIAVADSPNGPFTTVLTATAADNGDLQEFVLPAPVTAKYIKYSPLNNRGGVCCISTQQLQIISPQEGLETVTFANRSTDPDGDIATYHWDFGDGESSTEPAPTHTYAAPGTYTVALTVTDALGHTSTWSLPYTVVAPLAPSFIIQTANPKEGQYVVVKDTTPTGPDQLVTSRTWNFGEGFPVSGHQNPAFIYYDDGTYTVTFTVTDDFNRTYQTTAQVTVTNVAPTVQLGLDRRWVSGVNHRFNPGYSDPAGTRDPFTCAWDFGDGTTSTICSAEHTYNVPVASAPQSFTATLTVSDGDGGVSSDSVVITVWPQAFEQLATGARSVVGVDWSPLVQKLVVTLDYPMQNRLALVGLDGTVSEPITPGIAKGFDESKIAVADGRHGWQSGDVFMGNGLPGELVRIQMDANGTVTQIDNPWIKLPSTGRVRGGLAFDDVGTFGHDLLVVWNDGKVHRVKPDGSFQLVADLRRTLEGADVVPATGFGRASGCLLTTDMSWKNVWAICPDGSSFVVKAMPQAGAELESIHFVPSPGDFFFVDTDGAAVYKGDSRTFNNDLIGHALVTTEYGGEVWDLWYDPAADRYEISLLTLGMRRDGGLIHFEQTAFLPALSSVHTTLAPDTAALPLGTAHTVTATVKDSSGNPVPGLELTFAVTGANTATGSAVTNAAGQAEFTYTGQNPGMDTIVARSLNAETNMVSVEWIPAANTPPVLTAPADQTASEGSSTVFDLGAFADPDGGPWEVTLTWGDGTAAETLHRESAGTIGGAAHTYQDNGTYTITITVNDQDGQSAAATFTATVENLGPTATLTTPEAAQEGATVTISLTGGNDPSAVDAAAGFTYAFDCGEGFGPAGSESSAVCVVVDNPSLTVRARITDKDGGSAEYTAVVNVMNVAPVVGPLTAPLAPQSVQTDLTVSAAFTDPGLLDTHTAVIDWGDGSLTEGTVSGNAAVGTHQYASPGLYSVTLTVTDKDGDSGVSSSALLVVYDPGAGFVTGGGHFASPAAAGAEGKARFGFTLKYHPGTDATMGELEFQVRGINLHVKDFDWLVVSGARSTFQGTGTVNGSGEYGVLVSFLDGRLTGEKVDRIRIRIWDKATGQVIYDNLPGAADTAEPETALDGGKTMIHSIEE